VSSDRRNFVVRFLAGLSAVALAGCDAITNSQWGSKVLRAGEGANRGAQRALTGKAALAQEFSEADLSADFRSNGTSDPDDLAYQNFAKNQFRDWMLKIDGMVRTPTQLSLAQLRMMKARTQITRHDCVEGWSAIGKWTGVPLSEVLALAARIPWTPTARATTKASV
jgi:DMSO/TMAO reductase YedYZ molybdopterin-dependent catalytic subunit